LHECGTCKHMLYGLCKFVHHTYFVIINDAKYLCYKPQHHKIWKVTAEEEVPQIIWYKHLDRFKFMATIQALKIRNWNFRITEMLYFTALLLRGASSVKLTYCSLATGFLRFLCCGMNNLNLNCTYAVVSVNQRYCSNDRCI